MANPDHLRKLKEGVESWNEWRKNNLTVHPNLSGADLHQADFSGADFSGADLSRAFLCQADLSLANLNEANLGEADLREANLSGAQLGDAQLFDANLSEVNLRKAYLIRADLSGADLSGANLGGADLGGADLRGTDLREARLPWVRLIGANLIRADFRKANLIRADLSEADLSLANLREANLSLADLSLADLSGATLIHTSLEDTTLIAARVYGISAWNVNLKGAIQTRLVITPPNEPDITVDDLEIAQFIYLLVNRSKLRDVLTTLGEKAVLILGRFTERKELLDSVATKLRDLNYLPIIFDFERPTDRDLTETVKVLTGLSRFVIADITNPRSVPLELQATVPDYMVPFVTILQRGQPAFGMFDDLPRKYNWALPVLEYNSAETLLAAFEKKVIAPALEKLAEVRQQKALLPVRRSAED
jgi:uncharacterized protein YjbI with pentapeptide repeats